MKAIVVSESLIIRKGLVEILYDEDCIKSISESHLFSEVDKESYDLLLLDLNIKDKHYIEEIEKLKKQSDIKVMIVDFYEDKSLFALCMKIGADGYLLGNIESEDIRYAIRQLSKGKNHYDASLIQNYMCKDNTECISELTKREQEILMCIAHGKSNAQISKELYITEHTVKKHTSNIFTKLNVKDRTQATIYAYDKKIIGF